MTDDVFQKGDYLAGYYFGFDATGVPEVDAILYRVARAGKAFHHTEDWAAVDERWYPVSQVEMIQATANESAEVIANLRAELDRERGNR